MGCNYSKEKIPKYKRTDLTITIPVKTRGEHIHTFQRPNDLGNPDIIIFKDGVVKKTFPDNNLGHKRFENEINDLNVDKPILYALGHDVFEILIR